MKRLTTKKIMVVLAILLLCLLGAKGAVEQVSAEPSTNKLFHSIGISKSGRTYYVDGESGNDKNDGLTPETAWRSLTKVSSVTYQPGDHILLEASSTWRNQILHPKGSGEENQEIKIDFYLWEENGKVTFESDKRPIIHGGGTYGTGAFKRYVTGAVQLVNQEYWQIQNLEVTNTPDLADKEGYKKPGDAQRAGILILGYEQNRTFNSVQVKNNYVHDVQSEYYLKYSGAKESRRLKAVGGIIVLGHWVDPDGNYVLNEGDHRSTTGFNDVLIENNVVKRVALEGIRTKSDADTSVANTFHKKFSDIVIRNNYLEEIAGDAIVLSEVASGGLVEGNVAKRVCNADYGTHNYAAIWSMSNNDAVFQYNEVYGTIHGYNDAEAYDIDMQCENVVYQYNYSHHNSGGFLLLMSDQRNSIVRYNISANDGAGNKGSNADNGGGGAYNYKEQSIFHYWVKNDNASMPLIHNNTFYVGDGISTSLFGEGNSSDNSGTVAHFYNNILYKEGTGKLKFLANYPANGGEPVERKMVDTPEKYLKNNLIWPADIATEKSGATVGKLSKGQNKFADPKLEIGDNTELKRMLAKQNDTIMDTEKDSITTFTSKEKMRERASLFKISEKSPAVGAGIVIPKNVDEDFFGNNVSDRAPDIGAHQISNIEKKIEVEPVTVDVTTYAGVYPKLPSDLEITIRDIYGEVVNERQEKRKITWGKVAPQKYQQAGTFTVTGMIEGVQNPEIRATANVIVTGELGEGKVSSIFTAKEGAFIQRGNSDTAFGAKAGMSSTPNSKDLYKHPFGVAYSDNFVLKLKNAGTASYNRRFYVKFDPQSYSGDLTQVKNASIRLFISRYDAWTGAGASTQEQLEKTAFAVDVYGTDTDWSTTDLTWNNAPLNKEVTLYNHPNLGSAEQVPDYKELQPVSHTIVKNSDIINSGHAIDIDVSGYLRKLKDLTKEVSFLVDIPMSKTNGFDRDNSGFDAFSVMGAEQAYVDYQAGKLSLPMELPTDFKMTKEALAPKLFVSEVYETNVQVAEVDTWLGQAPALPEQVTVEYSDGISKEIKVNWQSISNELYEKEGQFDVVGSAFGVNLPIIAKVTVKGDAIVGFQELPKIDRVVGLSRGELGLPKKVVAILESDKEVEVTVTGWDDDVNNYSANSKPGNYTFPGAIDVPLGVSNPQNLKVFQTVETHPKPIKININESFLQIVAGESQRVSATIIGEEPYTEVDDWGTVLNWKIKPVDDNQTSGKMPKITNQGIIESEADTMPGEYDVIAISSRVPEISATVKLTVLDSNEGPEVERLDLNVNALEILKKGKTLSVQTIVTPPEAEMATLTWSAQKTDVATVDENGHITAKKAGTTYITVTASNGKSARFTLRVTK